MAKDEMSDKIGQLKCPFCGAELEKSPVQWGDMPLDWRCSTRSCFMKYGYASKEIWQAIIDGKAAQDALDNIIGIKESVEGCCAEIQQNCLPLLFSIDRDMKLKIDKEVSAIDKYMSEIDEIASITKQDNKTDK